MLHETSDTKFYPNSSSGLGKPHVKKCNLGFTLCIEIESNIHTYNKKLSILVQVH